MATATTVEAEEAEAVEEYESDSEEVKRPLVMRRREASDDEEEDLEEREGGKGNTSGMDRRAHIHSDDEFDGQGGAPADYEDEEEDQDGELEEDDDEEEVYDEEEEDEEISEEEGKEGEGNAGGVNIKGMESGDGGRSVEGRVDVSVGHNENDKNDGMEGVEEGKKDSNEPFAVPTAGAFYMHDDRFRENAGGRHRRTHGGRKLWESKDNRKWGHDKFEEMTSQERRYDEGRRTSRGRFRYRSKNRGPDHGYPRGNRSKTFNNSNTNQNQAAKGVRGRGPGRYEPAWKNNNQAPPQQNKLSGKPLVKSSHTNSGRAFAPTINAESDPVPSRKKVFASRLSSASPPFYPSGSSNKDINLIQKRSVQSGNTSRNIRASSVDESFSVQPNTMQRGKNVVDVSMDKLYIDDSSALAVGKPLNNLQTLPFSESRTQGRGLAIPQKISYQSGPPKNQTNRVSPPTQLNAVQRSSSQSRVQSSVQLAPQQLGQRSASGSQASSPPKSVSVVNSNDPSELESPSESSKSKIALVGKGKSSQGRGSYMYGGTQVMGATGNMTVGPADQNFPTFLPVMQFGGQHPGGIGVPAVGMAFPGYVAQPQLGVANSEMTWLPVLAGAAGALGATYCPPYIAVDGAYHPRPLGQTSSTGSSSKEITTNKPSNEWKPSLKSEPGNDEFVQQQNKPQPRRYSAMNLANDVLR